MGRNWTLAATFIGLIVGILFAARPELDLQISAVFFDPTTRRFSLAGEWLPELLRDLGKLIPWLFLTGGVALLFARARYQKRRITMRSALVLYLIASFALGPGLVTNGLLKPAWSRPRPIQIEEFGGSQHFQPWWRPAYHYQQRSSSFVSGEASASFWLIAPASIAPLALKPILLGAAIIFATITSGLRVAMGGHFVTDVVFAAVLQILITVLCHIVCLGPRKREPGRRKLTSLELRPPKKLTSVSLKMAPAAASPSEDLATSREPTGPPLGE